VLITPCANGSSLKPNNATASAALPDVSSKLRWHMALLVSAAIAISYLDRQTLPWAINAVQVDIPISYQVKAFLDSAFLVTYGLMYVGGGWLLDRVGTRRGLLLIMVFWSLACMSHGFAGGVIALAVSRLLLGMGEGGGFPAATRVVAEWFPVTERATAMGLINAATAVGGIVAPPLIAIVLMQANWLHIAPWRWVFFLTGALGLLWALWWRREYRTPPEHRKPSDAERHELQSTPTLHERNDPESVISLRTLLCKREVWAIVIAKFLSDGAWYFYLFWLPKYLFDSFQLDIKTAGSVGWIPYAASGAGSLIGGGFSSWLLKRGASVNASRKLALGASAALMPWVMFAPHLQSIGWAIFIFSLAFFGQQSWSTLVMILPTDMIAKRAIGRLAGLVGFGGAMGGVVIGQTVGWLRDAGYSYRPALIITGSLHVAAFILICLMIPTIKPLTLSSASA
jgi:MFS transporter, ACS family, hexuronate transporter